ncbi:MAG: hypothetical protein JSS02_10135 [Planctomycetes bacterium]|nr:hypothetical protein [Planctomycetota bacterium]
MRLSSTFSVCAILGALTLSVFHTQHISAEVVRVQIDQREPFAEGEAFGTAGPYERIAGRLFLEVDPAHSANLRITDVSLAPRNTRGRVEFWSDFLLLKPLDASRGNRRLFYDVNNRGNKLALGAFNNQSGNNPRSSADAGNGFLMRQGYSLLWCGWNGDVKPGDDRLLIGLPIATQNGKPITGRVHAEIVVNSPTFSQPFYWGNSDPYASVTLDNREAQLTRRASRSQPPLTVPPDEWAFARFENGTVIPDPKNLYLKQGFQPGWLYELVYTAVDPRVTGLGLAAVRDAVSFFKYADRAENGEANPLRGTVEQAYAFGISQSGRFINHFVFEGFNQDEANRQVFEGTFDHVGGGGKGYFNHRFAQTTRHGSQHEDNLSPSDVFPFTSTPQYDPVTGERGDILERARAAGRIPKMFFTTTSTEYWTRATSLLHTDVAGQVDIAPDPNVRIYFITGGQHGVSGSSDRGIYQNPVNILDHRPVLRALLVALDRWVTHGFDPPPSTIPRISERTLVDLATYRESFPAIPGVVLPQALYMPLRLDFGPHFKEHGLADFVPPRTGPAYQTLVPAVDADGNEIAGIRLPDIAVPLATYTGWNLRSDEVGAAGALGRWNGSYLPFPSTAAVRIKSKDPRRSIAERYPTRDAYLARYAESAIQLRDDRWLLDEDVVSLLKTAGSRRIGPSQ